MEQAGLVMRRIMVKMQRLPRPTDQAREFFDFEHLPEIASGAAWPGGPAEISRSRQPPDSERPSSPP